MTDQYNWGLPKVFIATHIHKKKPSLINNEFIYLLQVLTMFSITFTHKLDYIVINNNEMILKHV
jgi:hypothetical protein